MPEVEKRWHTGWLTNQALDIDAQPQAREPHSRHDESDSHKIHQHHPLERRQQPPAPRMALGLWRGFVTYGHVVRKVTSCSEQAVP